MTDDNWLDLPKLRQIAQQYDCDECFHSALDRIVILEPNNNANFKECAITVWYSAATLSITRPHPRRGRVSSFHFNVSLQQLEIILKDIEKVDANGYQNIEWRNSLPQDLESEEAAIERQLTICDLEEAAIQAERKALQRRLAQLPSVKSSNETLQTLEQRKVQLASENRQLEKKKIKSASILDTRVNDEYTAGSDNARVTGTPFSSAKSMVFSRAPSSTSPGDKFIRYKGNRCMYSFAHPDYQREFGLAWSVKPVSYVAMAQGYLIVYEDGGAAWWGVPETLDSKMSSESDMSGKPIEFVALGQNGNYFVKFLNGKMEWLARESFEAALKAGVEDQKAVVRSVSLGPQGIWIIVWDDGTVSYEGIPDDLVAAIEENKAIGVREVSLGPLGEWFVIFKDHSVQANNLPDSLHGTLAHMKAQNNRVRSIVFGNNQSWYIRYWDPN